MEEKAEDKATKADLMDDIEANILRITIETKQSAYLKESNVVIKKDIVVSDEQLTAPLKDTFMTKVEHVVKEPTKISTQKRVKYFFKAFLGVKRMGKPDLFGRVKHSPSMEDAPRYRKGRIEVFQGIKDMIDYLVDVKEPAIPWKEFCEAEKITNAKIIWTANRTVEKYLLSYEDNSTLEISGSFKIKRGLDIIDVNHFQLRRMISFIQRKDVSSILIRTFLAQKHEEVEVVYKEKYGEDWMNYEEELVESLILDGQVSYFDASFSESMMLNLNTLDLQPSILIRQFIKQLESNPNKEDQMLAENLSKILNAKEMKKQEDEFLHRKINKCLLENHDRVVSWNENGFAEEFFFKEIKMLGEKGLWWPSSKDSRPAQQIQ